MCGHAGTRRVRVKLDAAMLTLATATHHELVIKKSRFIACVQPVGNRREAQAIVAQLRLEHHGANHVCWALMAGGQSAAVDDGEPSGTAGRPMLEVLRHQGLDGVLVTVVRYFGGVKLGAGGLVRAYTDAVAQALLTAEKIERQARSTHACTLPYASEGAVRRELARTEAEIDAVDHGAQVSLRFSVLDDGWPELATTLSDLCRGDLTWLDAPAQAALGWAVDEPDDDATVERTGLT